MDDAELPRRSRGNMGGAARALAMGLAAGSRLLHTNGVMAASDLPKAVVPTTQQGAGGCGFRVTVWGGVPTCGKLRGIAGCEELSVASRPERVKAIVGDLTREAGIEYDTEAGAAAWREELDFGCVEGQDSLSVMLLDKFTRQLVVCELGEAASIASGQALVCGGARGVQFEIAVEHADRAPPSLQPQRVLQLSTPTPSSATEAPETETPSPVEAAADSTDPPSEAEVPDTPGPTPEAAPETDAPVTPEVAVDPPSPAPVTPATDPPVDPATSAPVTPTTSAPVTPETDAPVEPPTAAPVTPETPAPVTPATPEPTSRPVASTPEPTASATTTPPVPAPTPAPVTPPIPTTPEPTVGTPPSTDAPQPPPTLAPTIVLPVTPAPIAIDLATPGPVAATAPTLMPAVGGTATPAPTTTTTAPVTAPPTVTASPSPTAVGIATPSPNAAEVCTDACINDNATSDELTHTYYDAQCQGLSNSDLAGCNVYAEADPLLINCRVCVLDMEEYEAARGGNTAGYPQCPCCVASSLSLEPIDECVDQVAATPTPTVAGEVSIDLRTSANDPDLMMVQFNSDECTASGIAVISETKIMQVTRYSDEEGLCGTSFDILYGTECDSEDSEYTWDYTTLKFEYDYTCNETVSRLRRKLADDARSFAFEAEGSDAVLCNNGDKFISLSNLQGEDEGLVYAKPGAVNFDTIADKQTPKTDTTYCSDSMDLSTVTTSVLETGIANVLDEPDIPDEGSEGIAYEYVIPAVCALVLLMGCGCFCCYRHRRGKEGRADQMRRNLGYTPDMEAKGEGNFGPTNKHVAITRGGGAQVTPEMLATKKYTQPTYPSNHHRAPSEAPSSVIEDNIANNYRPKTAANSWMKRKERKDLTKPAAQQHVVSAAPTSEDHTAENTRSHSASARSEQLSEISLNKLDLANQTAAAQPNYGYTFEEVEEDDEDDDARSAATGMSGPSKYAPSGYAPSSHHGGVTHDLMSQYEPSVYEADSQYDPSLYGRESEYGDESSYSYNDGGASSRRGGYSGGAGGGRGGRGHISGRASVADTAAMSHLGSVREMDDGGGSAYGASESYVSSYVSSEDDDGRPARSIHPRAHPDQQTAGSPQEAGRAGSGGGGSNGGYSRHSSHRSGRQQQNGGRSGFSASSAGGSSSRHSGARSGFEEDGGMEYDDDDDESAVGRTPLSMDDIDYYPEEHDSSSRRGPLTNLDETHEGQRW